MEESSSKIRIKDKRRFDERLHFWTEHALNQFANASNFFFAISFAFVAYLFSNKRIDQLFVFNWNGQINYSKINLGASLLFALFSILASSITTISRLYDLRLTRHTIWTRKRYYVKTNKHLPDNFLDLKTCGVKLQIANFVSTVKDDKFYISDTDILNEEKIKSKFESLRYRNLLLGKLSWVTFKIQIIALIISLLTYAISYF